MQYMEELKVLEDSDRDACMAETGRPPIPTDWVDTNKGDSLRPNYRSRLVCQETRGRSTIDVEDWTATFAATPSYEAFKLQLSLMMTGPRSQVEGDDDVLMLLDISGVHLCSPLARAVFVPIDGKVYKLLKAMYVLREAGSAFDRKVLDVMNLMGVSLRKFSICVGYRQAMNTHLTCRDEYLFETNTACLVQLVRAEGEADPRHVEILMSQMGVSNESKAVSTPGVRRTDEEDGKELGAEDRAFYRSWTMGTSYLS